MPGLFVFIYRPITVWHWSELAFPQKIKTKFLKIPEPKLPSIEMSRNWHPENCMLYIGL
jgi:hypothetical protein